jgi:thymidine kinase
MAKLYFRYASMGAGKSLDLLKVAYNYKERKQNVLILSSSFDNRFGEGVVASRIGVQEPAKMVTTESSIVGIVKLHQRTNKVKINCLLVDECQFLTKEQVEELTTVVDDMNIPVICYGLRIDYRGEPFEGSCWLMAYADTIEEIKTICHCGKKATMNMRIVDGVAVYEGEQIVIGGNESYVSVCRKHYWKGDYGQNEKK